MRIYISGGCKNGKSTYADKIAFLQKKEDRPLYYIATMEPMDFEDKNRIKKHKKDREIYNFETLEIPQNINKITKKANLNGSFLIDSTTSILMNEMFKKDATINLEAHKKIANDLKNTIDEIEDIVIVSDYIYSDSFFYDDYTENFKQGLAYIDRECVKKCDVLIEVCYNNLIIHKGIKEFREIYEKII